MPAEGLFAGTYARGGAAEQTGERCWLQALLDVEAALARACAHEELIPAPAAEAITAACRAEAFDAVAIGREGGEHASVVVPLVSALREAVGDELAGYVHLGATSQDILDTAQMLVAQRALAPVLADAAAAAEAAVRLAGEHRTTPMAGRTLLQAALPTSFGLRAAGWLTGIDEARIRLDDVRILELAVEMGGPVGTRDPAIAACVAIELGLAEPALAWHTVRVRVGSLAGALGVLAGVLAKVARDVTLLAGDGIGEVREGGGRARGRSTAMAHKRNPVAAVSVLACAHRVPGLVATVLAAMEQEHERAAGAWQAEWGTVSDLLTLTGSATAWARDLLEHLEVDAERMRANLERLAAAGVEEAADPEGHLGAASELIDRALEAHRS
ncbi:MAG TPA: lyase family protein [Solirubrobacteraceae bacterium]|nr:lyase family protein [Solirubrobacteraceae bacterium]